MESEVASRPSDSINWKSSPASCRIFVPVMGGWILTIPLQFGDSFTPKFPAGISGALSLVILWLSEARQNRAARHQRKRGKTRLANENIPVYLHTLRNVRKGRRRATLLVPYNERTTYEEKFPRALRSFHYVLDAE